MTSVNALLQDAAIAHAVDLARYSNQVVRKMVAVLNRSDARLFTELVAALERLPAASFTVERLESLLGSVRALNSQAYAKVGEELRSELRDFVDFETAYQRQALVSVLPAQTNVAIVWHGSPATFNEFDLFAPKTTGGAFNRHGISVSTERAVAQRYADDFGGGHGQLYQVVNRANKPLNLSAREFHTLQTLTGEVDHHIIKGLALSESRLVSLESFMRQHGIRWKDGDHPVDAIKRAGYDSITGAGFPSRSGQSTAETLVFDPAKLSVIERGGVAVQAGVSVEVSFAVVTTEGVYAAAMARPFQGSLLKDVLADLSAGKARKIKQAVAQGFVEGRTTAQIVRALRGTRAMGYEDGLMAGTRRDVEAVTRTALGHMAGFVQDRTTEANADIIKAVQWSSTLDLRTSPICQVRDGKLYKPDTHAPIGHSLPWLGGPGRAHWNCRSAQVYILKSFKELGIDIPEVVMPNGTRATLDGQTPAETTYGGWLKRQSAGRQDEVLGPTRGAMLRAGEIKLADLYGQKGRYLSLDELRGL